MPNLRACSIAVLRGGQHVWLNDLNTWVPIKFTMPNTIPHDDIPKRHDIVPHPMEHLDDQHVIGCKLVCGTLQIGQLFLAQRKRYANPLFFFVVSYFPSYRHLAHTRLPLKPPSQFLANIIEHNFIGLFGARNSSGTSYRCAILWLLWLNRWVYWLPLPFCHSLFLAQYYHHPSPLWLATVQHSWAPNLGNMPPPTWILGRLHSAPSYTYRTSATYFSYSLLQFVF